MKKILPQSFFNRPALVVAEELIGKFLVRKVGKKEVAVMITETEAYDGPEDLACHASKERTKRTEIMFGPGGHFYVYFIYGMYWMLNIVVDQPEHPAAVLIRAAYRQHRMLTILKGPGVLTRELGITSTLNGKLTEKKSGLWIEDRGIKIPKKSIKKTPRIGVDYAGEWAKKPWRFVVKANNV